MVAVVTGAAGFIGRTLVRALAERGEVLGVDRLPQPPTPGLTRITADLLDADPAVLRALAGAEVVYHLAGCPDVRDRRPDATQRRYRDNVLATAVSTAAVELRERPVAAPRRLRAEQGPYRAALRRPRAGRRLRHRGAAFHGGRCGPAARDGARPVDRRRGAATSPTSGRWRRRWSTSAPAGRAAR